VTTKELTQRLEELKFKKEHIEDGTEYKLIFPQGYCIVFRTSFWDYLACNIYSIRLHKANDDYIDIVSSTVCSNGTKRIELLTRRNVPREVTDIYKELANLMAQLEVREKVLYLFA
jgi:hypothetical protein